MHRQKAYFVRTMCVILSFMLISGCAFVNGSRQSVSVSTNVPARIYSDSLAVARTDGRSPTPLKLRRGDQHFLVAKADGYQDSSASLKRKLNALGILDLIGAMIIALPVVTFATGHAYSIEPGEVHLELERARE
jgi:hypothetical protein